MEKLLNASKPLFDFSAFLETPQRPTDTTTHLTSPKHIPKEEDLKSDSDAELPELNNK